MRLRSRAFTMAATLLGSACPLAAQVVVGRVVTPDSSSVAGAIVTAIDRGGATVGRALTSQSGAFVLRLTDGGQVRLRVLRIGYRPTDGPTVSVAERATERVRIVFTALPVTLAAVGVREKETCRVSADTGFIVARVWEEARKAMLSTQLSVDEAPMFAEWIEYDRTLDSASRIVREQRVRTARNPTTHAFKSAPAEILREQGFVVAEGNATTYYAPDAEVLLSDAFVAGHCFRLVPPPAAATNLVGVGFAPTRDRRDMREIEGTLWVDRSTAELRTLEFRYLNLVDAAEPARPGGFVEFHRLADGNWFVSRWNVRMPKMGTRSRISDDGQRRSVMARSLSVLRGVQVTGGEVTRAFLHDSVVYEAAGPSISVQLLAQDSTMSLTGATLALDGTDYVGTADATGLIRVSPVLAGRYRARIRTPLSDLLGVPPVVRELDTRDDAGVDSLAMPAARDALASACPRDSIQSGQGLLFGAVRDEQARAVSDVIVTTTWKTDFSLVGTRDGSHIAYSARTLEARTDAGGHWRVCGVPENTPLFVRVATDSGSDLQDAHLNDQGLASVDLVLHRLNASASARALVEILVTDERDAPLSEAALEVESRGAPSRTVITGQSGRALVPDVAVGKITVRARRIGFMPGEVSANVDAGNVVIPVVMRIASAPTLDTMRVVGARTPRGRLDEFETRRLNHQATVSITREEIEKRNPVDTWQMLTGLASVNVAVRDSKVVATSRRAMIARFDNEPCFLLVAVDGVMLNKSATDHGFDLSQLPIPADVHGIEVFAGAASIPLQYGGTGTGKWCGLIAVWTR